MGSDVMINEDTQLMKIADTPPFMVKQGDLCYAWPYLNIPGRC